MKKLLSLLILLACFSANAQRITGILTVTGNPVNGSTIAIQGQTYVWTNGQPIGAYQILITNTFAGDVTNLFNVAGLVAPQQGATLTPSNAVLYLSRAGSLTVSISSAWATYSQSTNGTAAVHLVVPISVIDIASRTNVESQLANDLAQYSTNAFPTNAALMSNYVTLATAQTNGNKTFTNSTFNGGVVTNVSQLSINIPSGAYRSNVLEMVDPVSGLDDFAIDSNGTVYAPGGLNSSANISAVILAGLNSVQSPVAVISSSLVGPNFNSFVTTSGPYTYMWGTNGSVKDIFVVQINSTPGSQVFFAVGSNGVVRIGNGIATNLSVGNGVITNLYGPTCIPSASLSSLVNSNNADLATGTNSYVVVSGPTGPFYIAGIQAGLPGQLLQIENSTSQDMWFGNQSGVESTAANRILTAWSADRKFTNNPAVISLRYDGTASRWKIIGVN